MTESYTLFPDSKGLGLKKNDPNMPIACTPIMRLAIKYDCTKLQDTILSHFRAEWPKTLEEWCYYADQVETAQKACRSQTTASEPPKMLPDGHFVDDMFPEPASAIRFAQELDALRSYPQHSTSWR